MQKKNYNVEKFLNLDYLFLFKMSKCSLLMKKVDVYKRKVGTEDPEEVLSFPLLLMFFDDLTVFVPV